MSIKKITLTGGPCAGKSTALELIYEFLKDKYNVILINESATELINSGIRPFGENKINDLEFQNIILNYQLMKENILGNTSFNNDKDTIIICDRGIMDNKAYLSNEDFSLLLKQNNMKEISLLEKYDSVIHLVSAAYGAEKFYTLSNNTARTETIEEARIRDEKTKTAWLGHDDLYIVPNDTDFDTKMSKTIAIIENSINSKILKKQRKFILDMKYVDKIFSDIPHSKIFIEQQYLSDKDILYRLRKKTLYDYSSYTISKEELLGDSNKNVVDKNVVDYQTYLKFINNNYENIRKIQKLRYSFIYENQYFKIDELDNGLCILEITNIDNIMLPSFLPIVDEVTDSDKYYNYQLSKKIGRR